MIEKPKETGVIPVVAKPQEVKHEESETVSSLASETGCQGSNLKDIIPILGENVRGSTGGQQVDGLRESSGESSGETKHVNFSKTPGGKWEMEVVGSVSRRDINGLRFTLLRQWQQMKRRERLKARAALRNAKIGKEVLNG